MKDYKPNLPEKSEFFKEKVLHTVQELYSEYTRPIGAKAVCRRMQYRHEDRVVETLKKLGKEGEISSAAPGIWRPKNASVADDRATISKDIVRNEIKRLKHGLKRHEDNPVKYVNTWCREVELELG